MDEKTITALAREYAEESTKADANDPNLSESDLIEIRHDIEEYVTGILRFLFRRYSLVEKSKLQEEYRKVQKQMIEGDELGIHVLFIHGKIKKDLLESLFPEIEKEVDG